MKRTLIVNANIVNEGSIIEGDVLIEEERIVAVGGDLAGKNAEEVIDAQENYLMPGVIDDQVHFREPGLTHKANIYTESRAAVAGGVTSFMEMPNTSPPAVTQEGLQDKYDIGSRDSLANYSFYLGATNDNIDEVLKTDINNVCGVKIFMGSSTGNMLVDNEKALTQIFSQSPLLIATHCEDETAVRRNMESYREKYGEDMPIRYHPEIRSEEACWKSSSFAVELAKKHNSRLHILHISTAKELELFDNSIALPDKRITAEACIHHMWFNDSDYDTHGTLIKWNPAVKTKADQQAIFEAVLSDKIDVIATDHAPHTLEEKQNNYWNAPSGGPLIQHTLVAMLEFHRQGKISLEDIARKMSHDVAVAFQIKDRGYIREGHFADLALVDLDKPWKVAKENILAKCGWSPFEGTTFSSQILKTWISGHLAYSDGTLNDNILGKRMTFNR